MVPPGRSTTPPAARSLLIHLCHDGWLLSPLPSRRCRRHGGPKTSGGRRRAWIAGISLFPVEGWEPTKFVCAHYPVRSSARLTPRISAWDTPSMVACPSACATPYLVILHTQYEACSAASSDLRPRRVLCCFQNATERHNVGRTRRLGELKAIMWRCGNDSTEGNRRTAGHGSMATRSGGVMQA